MFTTVAGMRKRRCGGIFRRGAVRPDGAVGYRRVPVSLALFLVPYPEPALPETGTISLSRAQSSLLELSRREMEHENEGIIEAFRGGAAAHDCLSEQDRSPLRNAGRIGTATSETMDYPL